MSAIRYDYVSASRSDYISNIKMGRVTTHTTKILIAFTPIALIGIIIAVLIKLIEGDS